MEIEKSKIAKNAIFPAKNVLDLLAMNALYVITILSCIKVNALPNAPKASLLILPLESVILAFIYVKNATE